MLNKLSLRMKLTIGFGFLLAILVGLGIASYVTIVRIDEAAMKVDRKTTEKDLGMSLIASALMQSAGTRGYLLTGEEKMLEGRERGHSAMKEAMEKLLALMKSEEGKRLYAEIERDNQAFEAIASREIQLRREGNENEAKAVMSSQAVPAFAALNNSVLAFEDHLVKGKAKVDKEQDDDVASGKTLIVGFCGAGVALGFVVAMMLVRSISGAVSRMLAVIQQIANKNLTIDDMRITSEDEIGKAGLALNAMKRNLHEIIRHIADTAQHVASASEELSATSQQISANSEETSAQAGTVSQASQQVSQNLQSVSTGAEEMTSTIQSIATNAHEAATVASNAVQTAQAANANVAKLGASSAEIGAVIKVITSIAQQTNLLALNATIEAARAGEAGKGFAVVANEVKELAKQTAKATEDISRKITAIQTDTQGAVEAIGTITGVISQINDISGTIATAVEEQSATTNEMTRNVADAAKGSGEITQNIEGVAEAARGTSSSAQESQKAANDLAGMAAQLHNLVGQFKIDAAGARASIPPAHEHAKSVGAAAGR